MNPITFPQMWSGGSNPFDGDEIQRLGLRLRGNPPTIVCFGRGPLVFGYDAILDHPGSVEGCRVRPDADPDLEVWIASTGCL